MGALKYLTILLGLVAFSCADQSCPPQQIGSYCTCQPGPTSIFKGTKVVCRDIKDPSTLLKEVQNFRGYKIDALMLLDLQLPYLPAGLFLGSSVKELYIKDSMLDNLYSTTDYEPSPFAGLEDSLEEFYVYSTKGASKWYYPNMKGLKHLKIVEFVQSPINFVGHVFAEIGEGSLESITFAYSDVNRIHPQAFPELTNLKEVNFRGNFLPYMVRTMFPDPAPQLKRIDLSVIACMINGPKYLEANTKDKCTISEFFNLGNYVEVARAEIRGVWDCRTFPITAIGQMRHKYTETQFVCSYYFIQNVGDNNLFTLPENMFYNMPALEFLDLAQNDFKTFESIPVHSNLKSFYISNNPLVCGCHLEPLKKLLTSPALQYSDVKDVTCHQKGSDKKTHVKDLNC